MYGIEAVFGILLLVHNVNWRYFTIYTIKPCTLFRYFHKLFPCNIYYSWKINSDNQVTQILLNNSRYIPLGPGLLEPAQYSTRRIASGHWWGWFRDLCRTRSTWRRYTARQGHPLKGGLLRLLGRRGNTERSVWGTDLIISFVLPKLDILRDQCGGTHHLNLNQYHQSLA